MNQHSRSDSQQWSAADFVTRSGDVRGRGKKGSLRGHTTRDLRIQGEEGCERKDILIIVKLLSDESSLHACTPIAVSVIELDIHLVPWHLRNPKLLKGCI